MFNFAYYIVHQETNRVSYVHGFTEYLFHLIKPPWLGCSDPDEANSELTQNNREF